MDGEGQVRQPLVTRHLEQLGRNVNRLEELMSSLCSRIDPVMEPEMPCPPETAGKASLATEQPSGMASDLANYVGRVQSLCDQCQRWMNRLQI